MKIAPFLTVIAASIFFATSPAQAQHYGDYWDGGDGTWNATNTNWDGSNVYFNSNDRTTIASAVFSNGGGTVTVDNSAGTLYNGMMQFYNAGDWTFQGDDINSISTDYQAEVLVVNPGAGNVTINNTINIAPNPTNNGSVIYNDSPGTTLTLGNINISSIPQSGVDSNGPYTDQSAPFSFHNGSGSYTVNSQTPLLWATNGSTIVINGNYTTDANLIGGLLIGNYGDASMATGTYIFKGDFNENINGGKQFDFGSGNIIFDTSSTGSGPMVFVGAGANLPQTLLTGGAYTISNNLYNQGASNAILGGSTADLSTFTGNINAGGGGGELTYRAASGGRVIFSGNNFGDDGYTSKDGDGTVVLSSATGNTYTSYNGIVFEARAGTTLITNTSGSAFGNTSGVVNVDAGATLGGSGISTQQVVAVAGSSIIAPGDAGQANLGIAPTIGQLTLDGGLLASTGVTLAFKVDGLTNDVLSMGTDGNLTLDGTVTIDVTNLGDLQTGHEYEVVTGHQGFDVATADFVVDAPAGYTASLNVDVADKAIYLEFSEVPEPGAYALMIGGLAFLGLCLRNKRRVS